PHSRRVGTARPTALSARWDSAPYHTLGALGHRALPHSRRGGTARPTVLSARWDSAPYHTLDALGQRAPTRAGGREKLFVEAGSGPRGSIVGRGAARFCCARLERSQLRVLRFWWLDEAVIAAKPVVFEPPDRRRDRSTAAAAVVFERGTVSPLGLRFPGRDRAGAAAVSHVAVRRRQVAAMRVPIAMVDEVE